VTVAQEWQVRGQQDQPRLGNEFNSRAERRNRAGAGRLLARELDGKVSGALLLRAAIKQLSDQVRPRRPDYDDPAGPCPDGSAGHGRQ
jgi:hypothetical protein